MSGQRIPPPYFTPSRIRVKEWKAQAAALRHHCEMGAGKPDARFTCKIRWPIPGEKTLSTDVMGPLWRDSLHAYGDYDGRVQASPTQPGFVIESICDFVGIRDKER